MKEASLQSAVVKLAFWFRFNHFKSQFPNVPNSSRWTRVTCVSLSLCRDYKITHNRTSWTSWTNQLLRPQICGQSSSMMRSDSWPQPASLETSWNSSTSESSLKMVTDRHRSSASCGTHRLSPLPVNATEFVLFSCDLDFQKPRVLCRSFLCIRLSLGKLRLQVACLACLKCLATYYIVFSQPPWSETSGEVQQSKWKLSSEIKWTQVEVELKLHRLCWLCHIGAEPLSPVRDGASRLALAAPLAACRARAPRANGHDFTNVSHNAESFLTFFTCEKHISRHLLSTFVHSFQCLFSEASDSCFKSCSWALALPCWCKARVISKAWQAPCS